MDEESFEQHRVYLFRYAVLQLRDKTVAEDVVQETLLAAIENRAQFSGRSSAKTWLTGILKHKIIDQIRRRSREAQVYTSVEPGDEFDIDALFARDGRHWDEPNRNWGDPVATLEQKRFWEVLEMCMKLMPIKTARVFMMREFLGLTTDDICKDLEITSTNCWVMLYRARMSLRQCLQMKWFDREEER